MFTPISPTESPFCNLPPAHSPVHGYNTVNVPSNLAPCEGGCAGAPLGPLLPPERPSPCGTHR